MTPEKRELAPSAELTESDALHDLELIRAGVVEFFGPDSRYPAHNDAMIQILAEDGLTSPGIATIVELHDLVDHGLVNPKDESTYAKGLQLFSRLYETAQNKHRFIYATMCAFSVSMFEHDVAESWRVNELDQLLVGEPEQVEQLRAVISKDRSVEVDEDLLKSSMISGLADTTSLRDSFNSQDVEGLPINFAELLDNLRNPPENNPGSIYRDNIEILYAYAPALILGGFKKQGAKLRGKALEYFYDDPEIAEKAKAQTEKSEKHYDEIQELFSEAMAETLDLIAAERDVTALRDKILVVSRIKTEGSIREKLSGSEYQDVRSVPDGIGFRVVVLDGAIKNDSAFNPEGGLDSTVTLKTYTNKLIRDIGESLSYILTGTAYEAPYGETDDHTGEFKAITRGSFLARHSRGDHHVDDSTEKPRSSGYSAYHVTFEYVVDGFDTVPLEIQIVSATQEEIHAKGEAGEIWYKAGKKPDRHDIENSWILARRAEQMETKPDNEEVRPHGFVRLLKYLPNIEGASNFDTAIHRNFTYAETENARLLLPKQLDGYVDERLIEESGVKGDIILPVNEISQEDFVELLKLICPPLSEDPELFEAIQYVRDQNFKPRRDGIDVVEGHLLPVVLNSAMLLSLSSKHWDSPDSVKAQKLLAIAEIFHDTIEDTKNKKKRREHKQYIEQGYGSEVLRTVEAFTSPAHIKDDNLRRTIYAQQIARSYSAILGKPSDRMQNIMADIIRLATKAPASEDVQQAFKYEVKTNRHLTPVVLKKDALPTEYQESFRATMFILRSLLKAYGK